MWCEWVGVGAFIFLEGLILTWVLLLLLLLLAGICECCSKLIFRFSYFFFFFSSSSGCYSCVELLLIPSFDDYIFFF